MRCVLKFSVFFSCLNAKYYNVKYHHGEVEIKVVGRLNASNVKEIHDKVLQYPKARELLIEKARENKAVYRQIQEMHEKSVSLYREDKFNFNPVICILKKLFNQSMKKTDEDKRILSENIVFFEEILSSAEPEKKTPEQPHQQQPSKVEAEKAEKKNRPQIEIERAKQPPLSNIKPANTEAQTEFQFDQIEVWPANLQEVYSLFVDALWFRR